MFPSKWKCTPYQRSRLTRMAESDLLVKTSRRAVQLQNLFRHCGYERFGLNRAADTDLCIATVDTPLDRLLQLAETARRQRSTLCIMEPYADAERRDCCRRLTAEHPSTSVDNRGYLLLFNGALPKQHFKL